MKILDYMKNDKDNDGCLDCPFCTMIRGILDDICNEKTYQGKFEILHDAISRIEESSTEMGYSKALRNKAEEMLELADALEYGCDSEDEDDCSCKYKN